MKYSVQQLSERVGVGRETLRHYENRGILAPERNHSNGYRHYSNLDGLTVLRTKLMQGYELSLDQISQGAAEQTLDEELAHLDNEEKRLNEAMERIRDKLARVRKFRSFLLNARDETQEVQELETYGIYKLMLLGDEVEWDDRAGEIASQWVSHFPVPDIGWQIPLERIAAKDAADVPTAIGLMVLPKYMEDYRFASSPPVFFFPPGRSARMMLAVEDPFHVSHAQLEPLFDYAKLRGLKPISDVSGRFSGYSRVDGKTLYHFSARVNLG